MENLVPNCDFTFQIYFMNIFIIIEKFQGIDFKRIKRNDAVILVVLAYFLSIFKCSILHFKLVNKIRSSLFLQNVFGRCEGKCDVSIENRSYCKRCRMNKCISIGMKREMLISE